MIIFTWYDLSNCAMVLVECIWTIPDLWIRKFLWIWSNILRIKERYRCECGKCYDGRSKCFILCHVCPSVHLIICFYLSRLFQITCYPDLSYYDPPIHCCHLNPFLDIFLLMLGPFLLCYLFSLYPVHSYSFYHFHLVAYHLLCIVQCLFFFFWSQ